jgi:Zn-finger nucleic acid-binding protein
MDCPNCEMPLRRFNIGSVSLDECSRCRGIWFDKKELEEAKDEIDPDLRWMDLQIWSRQPRFEVSDQPRSCPRCKHVKMQMIAYQEPQIEILYCSACEGIWLDAGDLKKMISALQNEADRRPAPDYVRDSLKEAADLLTHPQDLVSEWRDLRAVLRLLSYRIFVENPKLKSILLGIQKSLPL